MHNALVEEQFELIFQSSTDALITIQADHVIDQTNPAFEKLTGFTKTDIKSKKIEILAPGKDLDFQRSRPFNASLLEREGIFEDYVIQKSDGSFAAVDFSIKSIKDPHKDHKFILMMIRDISEKKRLEKELIFKHTELQNAFIELEKAHAELKSTQELLVQAGKMAALGELTAGISHELNQPLQAIRGYTQESLALIEGSRHPNEIQIQEHLSEVIQSVDKMRQIIDTLRAFVRRSSEKMESFNLHQSIDAAFKMLDRQLAARGIQVERQYGLEIPEIFANPIQLEQVFINLASNARDAIDATERGNGTITVKTAVKGKFIEIKFSDNGMGMNENTQNKAFNPFFTTKEVGKGMGLGLSLSYGILTKLNASIQIHSKLKEGTTFTLQIPIDYRSL